MCDNEIPWWEKTVEYKFILENMNISARPLAGSAEKMIGDLINFCQEGFQIIEFKRTSLLFNTEDKKYPILQYQDAPDKLKDIMEKFKIYDMFDMDAYFDHKNKCSSEKIMNYTELKDYAASYVETSIDLIPHFFIYGTSPAQEKDGDNPRKNAKTVVMTIKEIFKELDLRCSHYWTQQNVEAPDLVPSKKTMEIDKFLSYIKFLATFRLDMSNSDSESGSIIIYKIDNIRKFIPMRDFLQYIRKYNPQVIARNDFDHSILSLG